VSWLIACHWACMHSYACYSCDHQASCPFLRFVVTASVQQLCCKLHKLHLHQALRLQCSVQPLGVAQGSCTAKFGVAVHQHTDEWCSCRLVWQTSRGGGSTWVPNGVEMAQTLSVHWSTATRLCATSSLGKMTVCARPARYPSCVCHTPT